MRVVVTGGAGFVGSHLVDKLIVEGNQVDVIDNLSSGKLANIERWLDDPSFNLVEADLKNPASWVEHFGNIDVVYHYAANPEIKVGFTNPEVHYRENLESTFNVLEACRRKKIPLIVFASTSTVYGEPKTIPTPETYQPLEPISIYGAAKLACEVLIQTYTRLYPVRALVLRYANIIGPRSTHGVIWDFMRKLRANERQLEILGDGTQSKSYLHIEDAVEATLKTREVFEKEERSCDIYNVGSEDQANVKEIADIVAEEMGLRSVKYLFEPATKDGRGWPGDVKEMLLDISKIRFKTGWKPEYNSKQAVKKTVQRRLADSGTALYATGEATHYLDGAEL